VKFQVHYVNGESFIVRGLTRPICRRKAWAEAEKRGWDWRFCWSEKL